MLARTTYNQAALKLTEAPSSEPVTLAELRDHVKVTSELDGTLLMQKLRSARQKLENTCGRSFIEQKWSMQFDGLPCESLVDLPRGPVTGVDSVKYYDLADGENTFASTNYFLDDADRLVLKQGASWPTSVRAYRSLVIAYTAGYGTSEAAALLPECIKQAVLLLAAHYWENREATAENAATMGEIPLGIMDLLGGYIKAEALI